MPTLVTVQAAGGGVTSRQAVLGTAEPPSSVVLDDFSDTGLWTPTTGAPTIVQVTDSKFPVLMQVTTASGTTGHVVRDLAVDLRGRFLSFWFKADANFSGLRIDLPCNGWSTNTQWAKTNIVDNTSTSARNVNVLPSYQLRDLYPSAP